MGNGASTLTDEQKALITKEMKEKYDSIDPEDTEAQAALMKHYTELVTKVQKDKEENDGKTTSALPAGRKKNRMSRKRSFDNSMFLNAIHATPNQDEHDCWDSVTMQPTCIICKMVFATDAKLETHTKYSEVHRKNLEELAALEKKTSPTDNNEKIESNEKKETHVNKDPELPSFRCRELYSGSKLYWRLQDTIEYHLFLHLDCNAIEAIPYDNHSQVEYGRLYFDEEKTHTIVGADKILEKAQERLAEFEKIGKEIPKEADVIADERRQAVVSWLMSKLQLIKKDDNTKVVEFQPHLKEGQETPQLSEVPGSITPVLINRRRLSTGVEIEAALQQATDLEAKISSSLDVAEKLESQAHV